MAQKYGKRFTYRYKFRYQGDRVPFYPENLRCFQTCGISRCAFLLYKLSLVINKYRGRHKQNTPPYCHYGAAF